MSSPPLAPAAPSVYALDGSEVHELDSQITGKNYKLIVVSMAPAARWDNAWLARRERAFHATHPALAKRVWLSAASDEDPQKLPAMRDFIKQFEASRYMGLALRTRLIEGERHAAMKVESYNRGLRWVLAPVAPKPSE